MEFNVGDRVVATTYVGRDRRTNVHGVIATIDDNFVYGVVFDENVGGHDLANGSSPHSVCTYGFGWWMLWHDLKLESAESEDEISVDEEAFPYA